MFAGAFALALGLTSALADHGGQGGGDIDGDEGLHIEMQMTRTSAAPAGSSVLAKLDAHDEDGATETELEFNERHLPAATYSVTATLKSNGSTVQIGTFTLPGSLEEAEIEFSNESGGDGSEDEFRIQAPFPANVNPFDIATVSISFSNGTVLFTADFRQAGAAIGMTRSATVQATAGPGNPNATGTAMLNAFVSGHQVKGTLQLNAQGLPPKLQLTVTVNGRLSNVKKITTASNGTLKLKIGPKGKTGTVASGVTLFDVTVLQLTDRFGNVIMSAFF